MKQFKRVFISVIATVLMLSVLAGCGGKDGKVQLVDNLSVQPEYLSFFSSQSLSDTDLTKYWSDRFTEEYNRPVYINFDGADYYGDEGLSYRELLEKRLESSAPDDLYVINAEDVLEFEKKGYWMDLSDLEFVDNLTNAARYQSTYNGKVFSVPLSYTGFGFVWNLDVLNQYDLKIPENQAEFFETCEQLKNVGILPYGANKGYALTVPAMCIGFSEIYSRENRDSQIESLNTLETKVSDYMREGFEFLSLMIQKGYMDPQQALEATPLAEDVELFLSGECAFICADLSGFSETNRQDVNMEITGLPILKEGSISVYGANNRLCVNPRSHHLETALEFVEMVGTKEALLKSAELDQSVSSAKDTSTTNHPQTERLIHLLSQPGQIPNQDFSLHFNTWESIRDVSREICNGVSVEEACAMLDAKQKTELNASGEN